MKPARRAVVSLAVLLAACSAPVGPAAAARSTDPPPLIPRALLLGNPERGRPRLSPDGRRLSWLAADANGVWNVWAQEVGGDSARPVTHERHRPLYWYEWAGDSRHLLYLQDGDGDEVTHLFSADLETGLIRDLTPFRGVRAQNVMVSSSHPHDVLVALNLRDRRAFDLHRVDLETGAVTLEARNPGDVLTWTTDWDFVVRAATAFDGPSGRTTIRVRDGRDAPWRDLVTMPFTETLFDGQVVGGSLIAAFGPDHRSLVIHSALGGDRGRLVRVDARTGAVLEVLAEHPASDVADAGLHPSVILDERRRRVAAVEFDAGEPEWRFLDPALAADFAAIAKQAPGHLRFVSRDTADQRWIVAVDRSDAPSSFHFWDRATRRLESLYSENAALAAMPLARKEVVTIPARDGLPLVSYLTRPIGSGGRRSPLVLLIHGGPWARDDAGFDPEVQWLANRGYAVLQVNYRGSTGFGLRSFNLSTGEWGRGTQQDLYDAVRWAVDRGIADPARIAAFGWSGGGYATLLALAQRPDLFVCGVDGVGPGDLRTLFASFPPWWSGILDRWRRRVGDVEHDDALYRERSPFFHAERIEDPLLVVQGQNDPRVTVANADAMVRSLREHGRDVTYLVYPDEGHGLARPENRLDFYGRAEAFLARHLGGRVEPWQAVEGATAEVR